MLQTPSGWLCVLGSQSCVPLKQEALPSALWERAVAAEACSAGEHRGEARHQSSHASKAALQQPEHGEKNPPEQTAHAAQL